MYCYSFKTGQKGIIIDKSKKDYGIYWLKGVDYYWQNKENILFDFSKPFKFKNYTKVL